MGQTSNAGKPQKRSVRHEAGAEPRECAGTGEGTWHVERTYRQRGLDRTGFYAWKRRFQTLCVEGLKNLPPINKSHPQTTPEPVRRVLPGTAISAPCLILGTSITRMRIFVVALTLAISGLYGGMVGEITRETVILPVVKGMLP